MIAISLVMLQRIDVRAFQEGVESRPLVERAAMASD
jgi:hypothetical protein